MNIQYQRFNIKIKRFTNIVKYLLFIYFDKYLLNDG